MRHHAIDHYQKIRDSFVLRELAEAIEEEEDDEESDDSELEEE